MVAAVANEPREVSAQTAAVTDSSAHRRRRLVCTYLDAESVKTTPFSHMKVMGGGGVAAAPVRQPEQAVALPEWVTAFPVYSPAYPGALSGQEQRISQLSINAVKRHDRVESFVVVAEDRIRSLHAALATTVVNMGVFQPIPFDGPPVLKVTRGGDSFVFSAFDAAGFSASTRGDAFARLFSFEGRYYDMVYLFRAQSS